MTRTQSRTQSRTRTRKRKQQLQQQQQQQHHQKHEHDQTMTTTTTTTSSKTISAALKLVDNKKQNLKKAYDDLQSHSSHLSSFSLSWQDIDSHFTTIQNSLSQRFLHLQSLESQLHQNHNDPSTPPSKLPNPKPKNSNFSSIPNDPSTSPSKLPNPKPKNSNFSSIPNDPSSSSNPKSSVSHLEALSSFCKNNDGKGLRDFIKENLNDRIVIKDELQIAFQSASNPANMLLDSIDGLFGANVMVDGKDSRLIKKSCNFLFQQLRFFSPHVSFDVRNKAKNLFDEWKVNLVNEVHEPSWAMAFLQFSAVYGFLVDLNVGELAAHYATAAAAYDELPELHQIIALSDRVQDVIQKLIERGKHIMAVKLIFHFKLTDKTPPVPILKAFVNDAEQLAKRLAAEGKSLNEIKSRQIHSLKSVLKVIETHNLDSEFPRASLEKRIDELNKQRRAGVKPAPPAFAAKPLQHQQQQQLSGLKRPLTSTSFGPAPVLNNVGSANSTIHQYQQQLLPRFPSTNLLPDHPNPYMSMPPTMSFGMKAPTPTVSSYTGPSTGPYGLDGVPMTPSSNLNQVGSHPNSAQPQVFSGYYAPTATSVNLDQGGSHPNASAPQVMPGYYAPMGPSANLHQGGSHPNPSEPQVMPGYYDRAPASGAYGLQQYYGTSYPQ